MVVGEPATRAEFFRCVLQAYSAIELPWFPYWAVVDLELDAGPRLVSVEDPVDWPDEVAQRLWDAIAAVAEVG